MTKREILRCGGRRKNGNCVLAFCGPTGLEDIMRHAHFHYYRDVVCGNLSYIQYVIEFVNGHMHHDDTNAQNMNQHSKNHAIVSHLLYNQQGLVETYFCSKYELDYLKLQPQIFVTTATENMQFKRMPDAAAVKSLPTFHHCASLKIVEIAVECANKISLFKDDEIGIKDFMAILDCNTERKFVSNINRKVAYFFHTLSLKEVICEDWQSVIERQGFILAPSNNGKLLKSGDLATALNDIQNADKKPEYYYLINDMGDKIKEVLDKASQ